MTEPGNSPRILIVDDEEIVHMSCRRIFRKDGYRLDSAYSGEEALEKIRPGAYDVVITDLMMPGMGGMELLRILVRERPDLVVVVFTGFATVDTVREALKLGAFDYVPKPFTPEEMGSVIRNALKARGNKSGQPIMDLMAIVSHDLRSPLAVVHTHAETLSKGYFGKLSEEQQKALDSILRNCVYLEDIIRSYLDLSNMDLQQLQSFKTSVDLVEEVLQPVLASPEHKSSLRGMRLETSIDGSPRVEADPNLLRIVVSNLLSNAEKYGREGGLVRLSLRQEGRQAVIVVWNEGVGISEQDIRTRLFQKGARLKQRGTEGVKGNGLGLYICRNIVAKHQGSLECRSEVGSWAEFTVRLPLAG